MTGVTLDDLINGVVNNQGFIVTSEVVAAALAEKSEENKKTAIASAGRVLSDGQSQLKAAVNTLRRTRATEKAQAEKVREISRALRYFGVTGNPLPLYAASRDQYAGRDFLLSMGYTHSDEVYSTSHEAWKIPADWQPQS